uniref:39S ribosomal protein L1, mitochondrial n=1 Tax=Rhabditophanes sp. KR3021 TaxID=114890 RepID=A0AC35UCT4_9BILA
MLSLLRNQTFGLSKLAISASNGIDQLYSHTSLSSLLKPAELDINQARGRKRALKATMTRQQKLDRRLKREAKEAARKQYSFMERIQIRRMKTLLSPSQQFPGRLVREDEANLPEFPLTNIFIREQVRTQFYSIADALQIHRTMQQPSCYNSVNAPIKLRLELNMTTEKTTKMVSNSDHIIPVPHSFHQNEKRSILAFVADTKLQELAMESGAEIALGPDMIKKIIKGQFRIDDYDFCVAHVDMGSTILPLRGILKTRLPTKLNGGYGENLPEMIEKFKKGVKLNIKGDPVFPSWGLCDPIVGRLDMSDQEIENNIQTILEAVCKNRNPALGPFINRALMMVSPGEEHVALDVQKYLPVPTEEELEKIANKKNKKGANKKAAKENVEEDVEAVAV